MEKDFKAKLEDIRIKSRTKQLKYADNDMAVANWHSQQIWPPERPHKPVKQSSQEFVLSQNELVTESMSMFNLNVLDMETARAKAPKKITQADKFLQQMVAEGYQLKDFEWSSQSKHYDIKLKDGNKVATNPDGLWRSVQTTRPFCEPKTYIRIKVNFKPFKAKFKYVGVCTQLTRPMRYKGNKINRKGVYFGCGGSEMDYQNQSIQTLTHLKKLETHQYYGLYLNINGIETQISETTHFQPGDVVGIRFNKLEGFVGFDLNGIDYGVAMQHNSLKEVAMYPTADIGMGDDQVRILKINKLAA